MRRLWSNPITRKTLLERLDDAGFPREDLVTLQKLTEMEDSDLYDVLKYIFDGNYIGFGIDLINQSISESHHKRSEISHITSTSYLLHRIDEIIDLFVNNRHLR